MEMTPNKELYRDFIKRFSVSDIEKNKALQLAFQWLVKHRCTSSQQLPWIIKTLKSHGL